MSKLEEIKTKYANFDWHTFDIEFSEYFCLQNHPEEEDAQAIDKLYEQIYAQVAQKCNESGEYTIDCFDNRYTVRKISEIEQIHYEAMSDEEKAEYDLNKKKMSIENEIWEKKQYLSESDYIITKINEVMATGTDEEISDVKTKYAEELTKRKEARARVNELEAELEQLG